MSTPSKSVGEALCLDVFPSLPWSLRPPDPLVLSTLMAWVVNHSVAYSYSAGWAEEGEATRDYKLEEKKGK